MIAVSRSTSRDLDDDGDAPDVSPRGVQFRRFSVRCSRAGGDWRKGEDDGACSRMTRTVRVGGPVSQVRIGLETYRSDPSRENDVGSARRRRPGSRAS